MNHYPVIPSCFVNHMGAWACDPRWLAEAMSKVRAGTWRARAVAEGPSAEDPGADWGVVDIDGVRVIPVDGPLMKGWSKFGGTSTVAVRGALRRAAGDDRVRAIVLRIDSPGGHVAGTDDLARDVARVVAGGKRVIAYVEDMAASAAYWVASQASEIVANPSALIGSIGAFVVLEDSSKAAEIAGVKVHVIQTGEFKAIGVPGAPITDEQVAAVRTEIDALAELFFGAVASGRKSKMTRKQVDAVADGRVWIAAEAKGLGLIDRIGAFDDVLTKLIGKGSRAKAALQIARARAGLPPRESK